MAVRKKFNWTDPVTGKKYKNICTTPQFVKLLEKRIEEEEQAESFYAAYSEASKHAEHNVGYLIGLISDADVREDALDLFMVEPQTKPMPLLNREYSLSPWVRGGSKYGYGA